MFSSNQSKESVITSLENIQLIDPFTKWLIRIACIFIIIFFSGIIVSIPIITTFANSQIENIILNLKDVLKNLIESFL
tara:strand:- start:744 stop:977 length:234 start_codon:yes stop_codon:yes gene_type:complete